jgi:hypothetical protein
MTRASTSHGSRSTGLLPLLAGLTSALALTGAAVYTVGQAGCEPARYIRHADHLQFVGACLDGDDLSGTTGEKHQPQPKRFPDTGPAPQGERSYYRP